MKIEQAQNSLGDALNKYIHQKSNADKGESYDCDKLLDDLTGVKSPGEEARVEQPVSSQSIIENILDGCKIVNLK